MYCPIASVVSVVYDVVLSLLTVVQLLLPELLSQEYSSDPIPVALHVRVTLLPIGILLSCSGECVTEGGPVNTQCH